MYERFLDGLGWPVDLSKHLGYAGNIRSEQIVATHLPYYANGTTEVIFHAATRLGIVATPTDGQSHGK